MGITTTTKKTEKSRPTTKTETVLSQSYDNEKAAYEAVEREVKAGVPKNLEMTGVSHAAGTVELKFADQDGLLSVEVVVEIVETVSGDDEEVSGEDDEEISGEDAEEVSGEEEQGEAEL